MGRGPLGRGPTPRTGGSAAAGRHHAPGAWHPAWCGGKPDARGRGLRGPGPLAGRNRGVGGFLAPLGPPPRLTGGARMALVAHPEVWLVPSVPGPAPALVTNATLAHADAFWAALGD